jgi:hypothetical protein
MCVLEKESLCVIERERDVCVCMCVQERERDRVCVRSSVYVFMWLCVYVRAKLRKLHMVQLGCLILGRKQSPPTVMLTAGLKDTNTGAHIKKP